MTTAIDRRAFLTATLGLAASAAVLAACGGSSSSKKVGPDLSGADPAIRPQDDLFRAINGTWLRDTPIPPDKSGIDTFSDLSDEAQKNLKSILEGIGSNATGDDRKIRDLYDSYLDTATIDRLGLSPIDDLLVAVDRAQTREQLTQVMAQASTQGSTDLLTIQVAPDPKDATQYLPNLNQSGLGLPDESYYREPDYADTRAAYVAMLQKFATLAAMPDPAGTAQRMLALETAIAKGQWDNVRTRDAQATYNPRTWTEFTASAPGIDWAIWRSAVGATEQQFEKVVLAEPSYFTAVAQVWSTAAINDLREYVRLSIIRDFSAYLPKAYSDAQFAFYKGTLSGLKQQPDRWKNGVKLVDSTLGEALGRRYVDKYFPANAKKQALELVDNLLAAYRASFATLSWMTEPTRQAAIAKLNKITVKIGYPDSWRNYDAVTINKSTLIANLRSATSAENTRQLNKLGKPVDRGEWQMTPQTVNAYYDPSYNEIVFPAAVLQAPFFSPDAEPEVNYGGIGGVIGHEIGHGFDDQGSQYDGDGNLRDWWTPADRAAFDQKTKALIAQYNVLVPAGLAPNQHVDGALTVGENLADLGGLSISIAAYKIATKQQGPSQQQPTADPARLTQLFQSWARIWRGKDTPERMVSLLATDPHSPNEFRCNQVVRNLATFHSTFNVQPSDKEYLAPADRVTVWVAD
ncbi:M13 family metallopeptidase [Jongsikchunia kroppenstedtii]|uniref:M13 family metallopeptidase n=1 Tax=Jongsikchunia kroppenstedtii TaxID=1121721 RepID=UPI000363EF85|nr:M13 family metallopeptidase [Jongsikchunia kroppenstedtii]